jgi:hydrogenase nickel incorporation protein HypB
MCTVCGCGEGETNIDGGAVHQHADGTVHAHPHDRAHDHGHDHAHDHLHYGRGPAHAHAPGMSQARMVAVERNILERNDSHARGNRRRFAEQGIFALNLVSSPGSGKTTLLVETLKRLGGALPVAVIEGDQQTANDAERIRATGTRAVQINTGKGCHLDASQIEHALGHLAPAPDSVLFIENVGNLVCPTSWDLGESVRLALLSVTEGEDKAATDARRLSAWQARDASMRRWEARLADAFVDGFDAQESAVMARLDELISDD